MNVKIEIKNGKMERMSAGDYVIGNVRYYSHDSLDKKITENKTVSENCKYLHGLAVWENEQYIRIYNDPFCSHPVYLIRSEENRVVVTTQFSDAYQLPNLHIDHTGIYELLWLGQVLHDRTIFKEIKQLPAASYCEIDKVTMDYKILAYYNFDILENQYIDTQEKANEIVHRRLREIWRKYKNKKVLMGLSGGLDSRLSACLLSEYVDKKQLNFFTFGYNKNIKEYNFAKKVTRKLDLKDPIFIKLTHNDYREAEKLTIKTGGHVGMVHGHTYESLKHMTFDSKETLFISNYYSDAVMGWDARSEKVVEEKFEELEMYKKICQNKDKLSIEIAKNVIQEALEDLKKIVMRYNLQSNFSCFEEFYYVIERNAKFHLRSAYQCNDIIKTEIPFADFELLEMCISIPLKYRWEKKLEREIISRHYFDIKDISSRRYFERSKIGEQEYSVLEKIYYFCGVGLLRGLNLMNIVLAKVSGNRFQIINPYQTENQRIEFEKYFKNEFIDVLPVLLENGIISTEISEKLRNDNFRSTNIGVKFALIGLGKIIRVSDIRNQNEMEQ